MSDVRPRFLEARFIMRELAADLAALNPNVDVEPSEPERHAAWKARGGDSALAAWKAAQARFALACAEYAAALEALGPNDAAR